MNKEKVAQNMNRRSEKRKLIMPEMVYFQFLDRLKNKNYWRPCVIQGDQTTYYDLSGNFYKKNTNWMLKHFKKKKMTKIDTTKINDKLMKYFVFLFKRCKMLNEIGKIA